MTNYLEESSINIDSDDEEYILLSQKIELQPNDEDRASQFSVIKSNTLDNSELLQLLTKWDVNELYTQCLEHDITMETLKYMTRRHCELLTTDFKLQTLVRFEHHLMNWQMTQASANSESLTRVVKPNLPDDNNEYTRKDQNVNVENILKITFQGKALLENYKNNIRLTDGLRTILVEQIINYIIQNDVKMTVPLAEDLADHNQIKNLKKQRTNEKKNNRARRFNKHNENFENNADKIDEPDENIDASLETIAKNNCSWTNMKRHWTATATYRLNSIKNAKSTGIIIGQWLQYKEPLGYNLIEIDFKILQENAANFMLTFPDICLTYLTHKILLFCLAKLFKKSKVTF